MPDIVIKGRAATAIVSLIASLSLGLAACGSSSGGHASSSQAGNAAVTTAAGTTSSNIPPPSTAAASTPIKAAERRRRQHALAVVSCMRSHGVKLPEPSPQGYVSVNGSIASTPAFKAAVAKCSSLVEASAGTSGGNSGSAHFHPCRRTQHNARCCRARSWMS